MIPRRELVDFLDTLLKPDGSVDDPSNNGLQVEGAQHVRRVLFGVDACQALFEAAVDDDADFLFVHHGLSWSGGIRRATGVTAQRLRALLANGISLYASHLPLDMHPQVGHNAVMARELGIEDKTPFFAYHGNPIGWCGDLAQPATVAELVARLGEILGTEASVLGDRERIVRRVGIVSGGGADAVEVCESAGADCLITGELTHEHYHPALEGDVPVIVGGHYATEVPGVREVMARVRSELDVECRFVDLPTGL